MRATDLKRPVEAMGRMWPCSAQGVRRPFVRTVDIRAIADMAGGTENVANDPKHRFSPSP
jgi:hypothetical protein